MDEDIKKEPLEEVFEEQKGTEETSTETEQVSENPKEEDNKLMGILSYVGVLCLIPLLTKKDNTFVFFHAKQGMVLFIAEVITALIAAIPLLGWVVAPIISIIWLILAIIGIVNVLDGKEKELPILGKYADKIKI